MDLVPVMKKESGEATSQPQGEEIKGGEKKGAERRNARNARHCQA